MELAAQLLIAGVLATGELCTQPMKSGGDGPDLCHLYSAQKVETPYFSIDIEPDFLVGIDRQGRRMHVQATLTRGTGLLAIEVSDGAGTPEWSDCKYLTETHEEDVTWRDCHRASEAVFERQLVARLKNGYVVIHYFYTAGTGTERAPSLERMTQSIRIHAI